MRKKNKSMVLFAPPRLGEYQYFFHEAEQFVNNRLANVRHQQPLLNTDQWMENDETGNEMEQCVEREQSGSGFHHSDKPVHDRQIQSLQNQEQPQ